MPKEQLNEWKDLPQIAGVRHTYINVHDTNIHIAEIGKGKPIVLLHGWPQHWYVWHKLLPLLKNNYRLIMPDMRGFGWSAYPENNVFRKETMTNDVIAILDTLDIKQAGVVGHDWGGWVGFLACLKQPKRFTSFLALGILHPFQSLDARVLHFWRGVYQVPIALPFVGEVMLQHFPKLIEYGMRKAIKHPDTWSQKELEYYTSIIQSPAQAKASSLLYRQFLINEFIPVMRGKYAHDTLLVPTKLLIGDQDPYLSPHHLRGIEKQTNLEIEILKDCGHFIPEEMPKKVAGEITTLFI